MAVDTECTERIIGRFLRRILGEWRQWSEGPFRELLEQLQDSLPGVGGALLLSAWPRSTPEPAIYSSRLDIIRLQAQE